MYSHLSNFLYIFQTDGRQSDIAQHCTKSHDIAQKALLVPKLNILN